MSLYKRSLLKVSIAAVALLPGCSSEFFVVGNLVTLLGTVSIFLLTLNLDRSA